MKNPRPPTGRWRPPDRKPREEYPPLLSRRVKEWVAFVTIGVGALVVALALLAYLSG